MFDVDLEYVGNNEALLARFLYISLGLLQLLHSKLRLEQDAGRSSLLIAVVHCALKMSRLGK